MPGYLRLAMPMLVVGCVDLTRPPELITVAPDAPTAVAPEPERTAADAAPPVPIPVGVDTPDASAALDAGVDLPVPASPVDAALLVNGRPCTASGRCQSGICAQGVCCATACSGACMACDLAGSAGTCTPVAVGQSRPDQCPPEPAASCGRDGTCDGRGACRRYPTGVICRPGSCTGATELAASTCDGAGACRPGAMRSCAPNLCMGDSCGARCATAADCQAGFFCEGTSCRALRPVGAPCGGGIQCVTGACVDGVCCSSDCAGACRACNLPGRVGSCSPIADGDDPERECLPEPVQSCGHAGGCDGRGGCRLYGPGTACGPAASCSGATEVSARVCDGVGSCQGGASRDCGPYLCQQDHCGASCQSAAECQPGLVCLASACVPRRIAALTVNDTANASGWSRQLDFETGAAGAHPWTDFAPSFIATLDPAAAFLRGAEWVQVSSESKNFKGAAQQATITLSGTSDVYLIVDDRWPNPSFTSGWTSTGLTLRVFESNSRPSLSFTIFKKAAQRGAVALPIIGDNHAYNNFAIVN
jgi:hypothetical protein